MLKKLIIVAAVLLTLLLVVVLVAFSAIDSLARKGVVSATGYALNVPTSLDRADVGILTGSFSMDGLTVSNPEGFETPHFLTLDEGGINVSLGSLRKETVEVETLRLADIDIHLERADGSSNYGTIMENLKRFESGDAPADDAPSEDGKKFVIRSVEITNVRAHAKLGALPTVDLVVPEVKLSDVGSAGEPVTMPELASIIMEALLASISEMDGLPVELLSELQNGLAGLSGLRDAGVTMVADLGEGLEQVKADLSEKAEAAVEDVKEQAEDAVDEAKDRVKDGIRGLLGGGDDDGGE